MNGGFRAVGPGIQAVLREMEIIRQDFGAVENLVRTLFDHKSATEFDHERKDVTNGCQWLAETVVGETSRRGEEVGDSRVAVAVAVARGEAGRGGVRRTRSFRFARFAQSL